MAEEENSQKVSKYNTAFLINNRLHKLWLEVTTHLKLGRFASCDLALNDLWIELAGDLEEDKDYDNYKTKAKEIDSELLKYGTLRDNNGGEGFEDPLSQEIKNRNLQYKALIEKALFLKRLEKYLGKGTAWSEEEDDWD
jgi:hypothetical protein